MQAHANVTRQSATEGMVLLKNDNQTLPLNSNIQKVALFGCTSYNFIAGGTGSGNVNRAYTVSLLDGLKNANFQVNDELKNIYLKYIAEENERNKPKGDNPLVKFLPTPLPTEMALSADQLSNWAAQSDIALITLGRMSGEFVDRKVSDFNLSKEESKLINDVCRTFHAAGKKVVVILNIGGVIETDSWKNLPDAILCAWQAGQEGGNSVADILSGKAYPSGKLTMTFPVKFEDAASSANFPTEGAMGNLSNMADPKEKKSDVKLWDYTDYEEDIYVGYRYFDSFEKQVSYPFGYGLSYTTFEYGNPKVKTENGIYTVTVDVKNTGTQPGKEIVELYISAPKGGELNKPEKELKAFAKTKELNPGETTSVTMEVKAFDLASYNENSSAWVIDGGNYQFLIGASSRDIKATLDVVVTGGVEKTNNILHLQSPINILKK